MPKSLVRFLPVTKKRATSYMVFLGTIITVTSAFMYFASNDVTAGWFDEQWLYRKRIAIGNTGAAVTDKLVSITQDTAALIAAEKMQDDCDDIRITDINGKVLEHRINENLGIYYENATSAIEDTSDTSVTFAHTVNSTPNPILVVVIHGLNVGSGEQSNDIDVTSVTYNSVNLTKRIDHDSSSNNRRYHTAIFTLDNNGGTLTTGSSNIVVTFNRNVAEKIVSAMTFSGVNQSDPLGDTAVNDQSGGTNFAVTNVGNTDNARSFLVGGMMREGGTTGGVGKRPMLDAPGKRVYYESNGNGDGDMSATGGYQPAYAVGTHTMSATTHQAESGNFWNGAYIELNEASSTSTGCNSATSDIEVVVPAIPANGTSIYMYYGNSAAANIESTLDDQTKTVLANNHENTTGYDNANSLSSISFSHDSQVGPYQALFVLSHSMVNDEDEAPNEVISVTYGEIALTRQGYVFDTSPNRSYQSELWMLLDPPSGSDTVEITYTRNANAHAAAAMTISNVDQQRLIDVFASSSGNPISTISVNLTTTMANTLLVAGAARNGNNNHNVFIDSPGTQTYTESSGPDDTDMQAGGGYQVAASAGAQTVSFTASGGTGGAAHEMNAFAASVYPTYLYDEFTPTSGPVTSSEEVGPGPISYWKFDEGYGDTAYDSISTGRNGDLGGSGTTCPTTGGCPTRYVTSDDMTSERMYLYFDGTDDIITSPYEETYDFGSGSFSWAGWFRHTSGVLGTDTVVARFGTAGYKVFMNSSGYMCFAIDGDNTWGSANYDEICTPSGLGSLADSKWHHFAAVKSGTSSITLFIDGEQMAQDALITGNSLNTNSTLYVGVDSTGNTNYWQGFLDDLRIYPYARSVKEVKNDYLNRGEAFGVGIRGNDHLTSGLVGWWQLDDLSDSSGNSITLSNNGSTAFSTSRFANGGELNGTSQYFEAADSSGLSITADLTLSAWIEPDDTTGSQHILGKWDGTNNSYLLSLEGNQLRMYIDTAGNYETTTTTPIVANVKQHVAGVYNASTRAVKLYVNGVQQSSTTIGTIPSSIGDDAGELVIGADDSPSGYFAGHIDDARVYNRALEGSELESLASWAPAPTVYLPFDENTGSGTATAYDRSTGGYHASINNADQSDWVAAKIGSGYWYDGSAEYAAIGTEDTVLSSANVSFGAWIKRASDLGGIESIIDNRDADNDGWQLSINAADQLVCSFNSTDIVSTAVLSVGTWYHALCSSNGSSVILYINGVRAGTGAASSISESTDLTIARRSYGSAEFFPGIIDDVRIYSYARTDGQVVEDMNASHPVGGSPVGSEIAHWKFDDLSGATAQDSSENNNDLALSTASWTPAGRYAGAWNGTGSNWMAQSVDDDDLDFVATDDFTVSLWMRSDGAGNPSSGSNQYLLGKGTITNVGTVGYTVYVDNNGAVNFGIRSTTGDWGASSPGTPAPEDVVTSSNDLYDGSWHHIVAKKTGTSRIDLYVDGVLIASDASLAATGSLANSIVFRIGDDDSDAANSFAGDIDEVKVFRAALTDEQVRVVYTASAAANLGTGANERLLVAPSPTPVDYASSLVGYWPLDENTGGDTSTSIDKSGNGRTATLIGWVGTSDWVAGKLGSALRFTAGDTEYLDITNDPGDVETVTFWVIPSAATDEFINLNASYYIDASSSSVRLATDPSEVVYVNGIPGGTITVDAWNHVAVVASTSINASASEIGRANGAYTASTIDEVKFFSTPLTPAQIAYEYNRGKPLAWWRLDECQGTTANDASGNGRTGTITAGTSGGENDTVASCGLAPTPPGAGALDMWYEGRIGKYDAGLDFDGTNDYVSVEDHATLDITGDFSISAWVNRESGGSSSRDVVSKRNSSSPSGGYALVVGNAGEVYCQTYNGASVANSYTSTGLVAASGGWVHVTIVRTGSSCRVYVNGRDATSTAGTHTTITTNSSELRIGASANGSDFWFGKIDDVRVYNYALSEGQVKTVMNNGAVRIE